MTYRCRQTRCLDHGRWQRHRAAPSPSASPRKAGRSLPAHAREQDLSSLAAECPPGRVHAFPLDVTDQELTEAAVNDIETRLGEIDLAVLNAGTHIPVTVDDFSAEPIPPSRGNQSDGHGQLPCAAHPALCGARLRQYRGRGVCGGIPRPADLRSLWRDQGRTDQHVRSVKTGPRPPRRAPRPSSIPASSRRR